MTNLPDQPDTASSKLAVPGFDFTRDTFAFANELLWEYQLDAGSGKMVFRRRQPPPDYAHRCFVLARTVRQFFYHARFAPGASPLATAQDYLPRITEVVRRSPRERCKAGELVEFPGFAGLRDFSLQHAGLLKSACGGAWQSYVLRSHWRMVFPISRDHQERTMRDLSARIREGSAPVVHLVRFPDLTINHGMVLFELHENAQWVRLGAYDPNDPLKPTFLTYDRASRTFSLPANQYWAGGPLNLIEIYRSWFM